MSHWSVYLIELTVAAAFVHGLRAWCGRRARRRHCERLRTGRELRAAKAAEGGHGATAAAAAGVRP